MSNKMPKQHLGAYIGPAPSNRKLRITMVEKAKRQEFCEDLRHTTPCPLPCKACEEEDCTV